MMKPEYDEYIDPGNWHWIAGPVDAETAAMVKAAPDLLAACDDAVAALMLLPPDCLDGVAGQPSRDELINNIFSAIARARPE